MKKKIVIVTLISLLLLILSLGIIGKNMAKQENKNEVVETVESVNALPNNNIEAEKNDVVEESVVQQLEQVEIKIEEKKHECEFVISCVSILDKETKRPLPKDGIIFSDSIEFADDISAYDLLKQVTRTNKIQIEVSETPLYESIYIEGIDNIYEFDYGPTSGWTYRVNGDAPEVGVNKYVVKAGDKVEFIYVTEWQSDIGG